MNITKTFYFLTITILMLSITACDVNNISKDRDKRAKTSKGDIIIGAAGPWEILKKEKDDLQDGIILAVDEINSSGGVLGRKLKVIWKDDKGTIKQGKLAAREFCDNPNVVAVIGHVNSSVALATSVLYNHYGILMLSPTATTSKLTTRPGYNLIFRNIVSDTVFAEKLAEYAANTGFKNIAFINNIIIYNEDDVYGDELAKEFENKTNALRIKTVARRTYGMNSDDAFFRDDLKHVAKLYDFDSIFIAGLGVHTAMIINSASKLGLNVQIFCGDGIDGHVLIDFAGKASDGTVYCSTFNPNRKNKKVEKFKTGFKKRFGILPEEGAVQGYDAVFVLASAIKKAESTAPTDIADALHKIKYNGVAGDISFDRKGDLIEKNIVLKRIENLTPKVIEYDSDNVAQQIPIEKKGKHSVNSNNQKVNNIIKNINWAKNIIETKGKNGFKLISEKNKTLGDSYVYIMRPDGMSLVDPTPGSVGRIRTNVKDVNGNPIVLMALNEANTHNGGWIHYLWTRKGYFFSEWKTAKVIKTIAPSGKEYILVCGCFNVPPTDQFIVDLVDDFIEMFTKKGKAIFSEFKKKSSRVVYEDSYIFILDSKGTILFNPPFPELESRNMYNYKDFRGKYIFRDMIELAIKNGSAWIENYWNTPADNSFKLMRTYVKKLKYGNRTLIVGAGYFLNIDS